MILLITVFAYFNFSIPTGIQHDSPETISPSEPQIFILMGDAGTTAPVQFSVAEQIKKFCDAQQTCQAGFIVGDVIYDEGVVSLQDKKFKTHFEEPYAPLNFPIFIAYGNHDYLGCTQCYLNYTKISQKWKMPSRYYIQEFDAVTFIVIDTEKFDLEQQQWLSGQLANSTKLHTVVLGHRPLITDEVEKHLENWNGKKELTDIICNSADFYVSGHAHLLENPGKIEGCSVQPLISGTAGSYPRQVIKNADSPFQASVNGFLALEVVGEKITYSFIDKDGTVLQ